MLLKKSILIDRAFDTTFRRRAVVADDVDDHGVVGVRKLSHGVEHAADLVIDVGAIASEHLHHARVETLLIGIKRLPSWQASGTRCEFRIRGDDPELLLPLEGHLSVAVPAHVELTFELVNPLL